MVLNSSNRRGAAPYFLPLVMFPLLVLAAKYGGWWIVGPFAFLFITGFDPVFGIEERNIDPKLTPESKLFWFKLSIWLWALLWPLTLIFVLWQILAAGSMAAWERVVLVFALAMIAPLVFIISHEFIHRRAVWERRIAEIMLTSVSYPLYAVEHVYIHHARVCTPLDPESAVRGISFWQFLVSGLPRSFKITWQYECSRLARRNQPAWHISNVFWRYLVETAAWYTLGWLMGGWKGVLIFIIMGASVIFQMRLSDYIQHYGLLRVRLPDGRFERVQPHHAWSADYRITNWLYYNSQRHPDHHAIASRRYPVLQHHGEDTAPQLPGTYSNMMFLAMFPRRWFEKMNPLVDQQRTRFYPQIDDWSAYDSKAFASRPQVYDTIDEILSSAPRLADWMNRSPKLLDSLKSEEFTNLDLADGFGPNPKFETIARRGLSRVYWMHELGLNEMKEQLADFPAANADELVDVAREWSNSKAFQLCVHAMRANLTAAETRSAASRVLDVTVSAVADAVCEDVAERMSPKTVSGFGCIAFGDLASHIKILDSQPMLLFLCESESSRYRDRLQSGLQKELQALSSDNLLIASTCIQTYSVLSYSDFLNYYLNGVSNNELLKLVGSRLVFTSGDSDAAARFEAMRREILARSSISDALASELRQSAGSGSVEPSLESIQDMKGGLLDVERAARFLQLKLVADMPEICSIDAISVFETVGRHGLIPQEPAQRLTEAAKLWYNLTAILGLVSNEGFVVETASGKIKNVIAQAVELEDFETLMIQVREIASHAAACIDSISKPAG